MDRIFIRGEVASSKNSKRIVKSSRTHRPIIIGSKASLRYTKLVNSQFCTLRTEFIKMAAGKAYPLKVEFQFVRATRRLFDFNNLSQSICDLMVAHDWIIDDNYKILVPVFNPVVLIDKHNPGVFLKVL